MITEIQKQKQILRQKFYSQSLTLPNNIYRKKASNIICKNLQSTSFFKDAKTVLLYYPSKEEVNITSIIENYFSEKDKHIYLPSTSRLSITQVSRDTPLKISFNSIKEPVYPNHKLPQKLNLAVIPGIFFDKQGFRLGHGKGWYDQLLCKVVFDTIVGLSFEKMIVKKLPIEDHDKKVDFIITEKRIIDCR